MSDRFFDEPEELEPIEEVDGAFEADTSILAIPSVASSLRNFNGSPYPCCVLDSSLQIVWRNPSFLKQLPEVGGNRTNLVTFFPATFGADTKSALYASLRSSDKGFSWRGEVMLAERDKPQYNANLLIAPIIPEGSEADAIPSAYLALIDDISEHRRDLVRNTFYSLLEASLLKDNDTGNHVKRVNEYSRLLAERLDETGAYEEIDFQFVDTISFVAAMHDVGKIGTPDDILNKDGPLEDWEWEIMREHTINGAYILNTYPDPMAKQIALFHHEWWDGTGYPYQISAAMIPLSARIVSIADVYDALRMKRAYKPAFSHQDTCKEIDDGAGTHFDPDLVAVFLRNSEAMREIFDRLKDE